MNDRRGKWAQWRIRLIGGLFAFFFVITSARAFYLQVVEKELLVKLAERQHQKTVALTPGRGTIYDRTNAPLAVSIEMDSCYAEPRNIENIADTVAKLAPLVGMPREELTRKLTGSKGFVWLVRRISPDQARKMGSSGFLVTERDALGRDIAMKGTLVKEASKGHNVTLTLDKNIQYIAEKELAAAVESSRAKGGIALVMEPQTGRVLAIANYPSFNPNSYFKYPPALLRNKCISDSFEPGSTFKVFLIAAALEEKVVTPGDGFNCEGGSYSIGGRTIHDTHHYGRLSVADVLKYSSNIGAAKIGGRLGQERLHSYLRNFGFGARSGIDLPGEASGYLRDRSQWFAVDLATISFGQGVTASAMQLAAAFSAVANGGTLMKPFLVERISDENGNILQQFSPQARQRVISLETARTVARMMEGVTTEGGTGMNAALEGYRVSGKTGTAQKVDPITRGYSVDKRTASFIGFIPADDPRLTILVVIDEPKTSPYGGVVAAPAFKAIAQQSLCYLNVSPAKVDKTRKQTIQVKQEPAPVDPATAAAEGSINEGGEGVVMADFRGQSMRQVLRIMEKRGLNVKLIGSGRAIEQGPLPGHRIGPSDHVWVRFVPAA